jgi:short-subunit dehydrogenase
MWAARGEQLFLVGRDPHRVQAVADDLTARGAGKVDREALDLTSTDRHRDLIQRAVEAMGYIDIVLIAHGILGDQKTAEHSFEQAREILDTNFTSVVSLLTILGVYFEERRDGCILVISSVAGDRGRRSNYVYGSSKAAKSAFLQGLRGRLHESNVVVTTIKPGFVDTAMTSHLKKGLLWAQPETIARGIVRAAEKRKDVVYLPWFWWPIMCIVRHIPEWIFKRLPL